MTGTRQAFTDYQGRWSIERMDGDPPGVLAVIERLEADVAEGNRIAPSAHVLQRLLDTARRDDGMPTQRFMAALQARAKQCGLEREDRLELADVILRRQQPITTWRGLTVGEAQRLMDAMEGFALIAHLQAEQGRRWRYGECPADCCPMAQTGGPDPST